MKGRHVYVVDDEEAIRRSLQLMLRVIGYESRTFETGTSFLRQAPTLAAGCVLLDIRMPEIDGFEVQRRLNRMVVAHAVIVMSGHGDLGMTVPALQDGAVAFLEKPFSRTSLEDVLAIAFLKLEDPADYQSYLDSAAAAVGRLAETEKAVLAQLVRGHGNGTIAAELGLSPAAVDMCRTQIFAELEIDSVNEALRLAIAAGLPGDAAPTDDT